MTGPKAMFFFSVLLLMLTSGFIPSCREIDAAIVFPDTNLERFIRQATNQPEGDISRAKLENLVKLDLKQLLIQDLTGIEYCINLTELNLETNEITDLTPLSSLTKLETLNLSSNPFSDLTRLAEYTQLKSLTINNVSISDLTPLSNLISLRILKLSQFEFDRRLSFSQIRQIEEGDYVSNEDISPLANLRNLTELCLEAYFIEDVSYLAALTDLEILSLRYNNITDTFPLTGLKNLLELRLDNNPITDLKAWIDYIPAEGQFLRINLKDCPLNETSVTTYIPLLKKAGIRIER